MAANDDVVGLEDNALIQERNNVREALAVNQAKRKNDIGNPLLAREENGLTTRLDRIEAQVQHRYNAAAAFSPSGTR